MIHSGDVMDYVNCKGKHTVSIELRRLDRNVQSVVVVLSAFNDATMEQALQPNVAVFDEESGSELCRYELESKASVLQGMKNVVMCRVWRQEAGAAWRVDAIGSIGAFGDATNYDPIVRGLEATYKVEKKPAVRWERGLKGEAAKDGKKT
jgi:stress response protein SCP2